jgi:REP element-mobilizing transposase RayT
MVCGSQTIPLFKTAILALMDKPMLGSIRNSKMFLAEVYFWTDTVKDWKLLLKQDKYKQLIIDQLKELTTRKLIVIYGFVIMPNHIHLVWELITKNGKEMPNASFNKAVGHGIIKDLKQNHPLVLPYFEVEEKERKYRIWQRSIGNTYG